MGQMKASAGTAGPPSHQSDGGLAPLALSPAAMVLSQKSQLLSQDPSAAIATQVVIAENHCQWVGQRRDPLGQPQVSIAQISDEQHSIRLESRQNRLIRGAPGSMEITGNRNAKIRQNRCLGWSHPAPARFR